MVANTYGERLTEAMGDAGVNASWAAQRLGISYQAVKKVLDGKTRAFSARHNAMAARELGVRPDWLAEGTGTKRALAVVATEGTAADDAVSVPMMAVAASAGPGIARPNDDIVTGTLTVSSEWVAKQLPGARAGALRFISAYGNSMSPTFESGDVLLVDTSVREVDVDGIYVLSSNLDLFIKRVTRRLDGQREITSDNPLVRKTDTLNGDHQVDVLGRVVWVWNGKKV